MKAFLQIRLATGLGLRSIHRLIDEIRKPEDILSLTTRALTAKSIPPKIARDLLSSEARELGENVLDGLDLSGGASYSDELELSDSQRMVRDALSASEETAIDTLLSKLALPRSEIYSALFELELAERVSQLPGDRYVLRLG